MDPLSDVVSLLEPRSYFVGGFETGGDWSIRFGAYGGIKCYAVTEGACRLTLEDTGETVELAQGDCVLLPHGAPFRVGSDPALPAEDWQHVFRRFPAGTLATLKAGGGVMVVGGHFLLAGPPAGMLLGALPPIVHLRGGTDRESVRWAVERMRRELTEARPGSALILQQLVYMIFVDVLRLHLGERTDAGWLSALSDPRVSRAMTAIHREPDRRWTVATLAIEAGQSRAGFAARFRRLVGEGPIEYLTRWRMLLAGRSLERGEPIGPISRALGYRSESAFSTAFKRVTGRSPRRHARATAAPGSFGQAAG